MIAASFITWIIFNVDITSTSKNINNNESATRRYISNNWNINTRNDNVIGDGGGSRTLRASSANTHTQTQNGFKLVRDQDVVIHLWIWMQIETTAGIIIIAANENGNDSRGRGGSSGNNASSASQQSKVQNNTTKSNGSRSAAYILPTTTTMVG